MLEPSKKHSSIVAVALGMRACTDLMMTMMIIIIIYYYIIVMMLFGSSLATALQPRNHHLERGAKLGSWPPNWRTAAAGLRCEGTAPGFCQMCETNQNT